LLLFVFFDFSCFSDLLIFDHFLLFFMLETLFDQLLCQI